MISITWVQMDCPAGDNGSTSNTGPGSGAGGGAGGSGPVTPPNPESPPNLGNGTPPRGPVTGNPGSNPGGNVGGDNGMYFPTDPVITKPVLPEVSHCAEMKRLIKTDPIGPNLKEKLRDLRDRINQLQEHGFEMSKNRHGQYTNTDVPSTTAGPENGYQMSISMRAGPDNYGSAHTHPTIAIEMFSFGDVHSFYKTYKNARADLKSEVVSLLVCEDNNDVRHIYALKIDDFTLFEGFIETNFASTRLPNTAPLNQFIDKIDEILTEKFYTLDNNSERAFLRFFQNAGISVYEASDDITSWKKLSLETPATPLTSGVKKTPCS